MANITLQFGVHKGKSLETIRSFKGGYDYLVWLAGANITRQNASKEAAAFLNEKRVVKQSFSNGPRFSREEIEWVEEQRRIEENEREAWEEKWMIRWTAKSGQRIEICLDQTLAGEFGFCLGIDGKERFYAATDIKPVSDMPGIVAKIGNVGISEERRNALRVMWKKRSEWVSC